jgi:hypothetical protein
MSGRQFEYKQFLVGDIIDSLEELINKKNEDEYGYEWACFSDETIEECKTAIKLLEEARVYLCRIDWLVKGYDDEANFLKRLAYDLQNLRKHDII